MVSTNLIRSFFLLQPRDCLYTTRLRAKLHDFFFYFKKFIQLLLCFLRKPYESKHNNFSKFFRKCNSNELLFFKRALCTISYLANKIKLFCVYLCTKHTSHLLIHLTNLPKSHTPQRFLCLESKSVKFHQPVSMMKLVNYLELNSMSL